MMKMVHSHHEQAEATRGIRLAFFLNAGFTILEVVGGFLTNSTAILADAAHDLGDSFALGQAWYFERLAGRGRNGAYTYGYRRFSLMGSLLSTVFLLLSSLYILSRAVPRILRPEHSNAQGMVVLAIIGVTVNALAMKRLARESSYSARTIALHFLEDVLGWLAVLFVAVVLLLKDVHFLDPVLAVLVTLYVLARVVKNLRSVVPVFLQAAPKDFDVGTVTNNIEKLNHVQTVHHAHVWSLDGKRNVLTVHIIADRDLAAGEYHKLKQEIGQVVKESGIFHSTVEIEFPDEACRISDEASCE